MAKGHRSQIKRERNEVKDTRTSAYDSDVCGELFQNILPVPSAG